MRLTRQEATALRQKLRLIVDLIAVSTVLYGVGVVAERQSEAAEGTGADQQESSDTPESGEAGEAAEAYRETGPQEVGETGEEEETILGINPEAPWAVAAVVIGWLVLAAGLLRFRSRVVVLVVALGAAASAAFDALEVLKQVRRANSTVAILAALVALGHAAIVVLSVLVLRAQGVPLLAARRRPRAG